MVFAMERVVGSSRRHRLLPTLTQLRAAGASVEDETAEASYGRFGHAVDPEGNRFELWEPGDDQPSTATAPS